MIFVNTSAQYILLKTLNILKFCFYLISHHFFFFCFLGLHPRHIEVPRVGVQSELQLSASATITAMPDPSHVCDLHHSSPQCQILNPLSEARDWTRKLMVPSRICLHCATTGTPLIVLCHKLKSALVELGFLLSHGYSVHISPLA